MAKKTKRPSEPMHLVACPGEAHSNPHIDNCGICAPRWGKVEIPLRFATYQEYQDARELEFVDALMEGR